jgi:magnesium-dependent phosphatase 1
MGVYVGSGSSTAAPDIVRELLRVLVVAPSNRPVVEYFNSLQIRPGSKTIHVQRVRDQLGIEFEDMIFFDDEIRNKNVERELGVFTFIVRNGITIEVIEEAVVEWRRRRDMEDLGRPRRSSC